jgi:hypothetical protein
MNVVFLAGLLRLSVPSVSVTVTSPPSISVAVSAALQATTCMSLVDSIPAFPAPVLVSVFSSESVWSVSASREISCVTVQNMLVHCAAYPGVIPPLDFSCPSMCVSNCQYSYCNWIGTYCMITPFDLILFSVHQYVHIPFSSLLKIAPVPYICRRKERIIPQVKWSACTWVVVSKISLSCVSLI